MAMDKTTTRRMIGAIVLVLVAALVLAYLLKGKNNQPVIEKIHDVTLPGSPVLAFPGTENMNGITPSLDPSKAGLNIVPDTQPNVVPKTVISGGYAANAMSTAEQEQAPATEKQKVQIANAKSEADKTAAEEKSKQDNLKKADVVKLDNKEKVSSSEHKSRHKKEETPEPKLVNEKKLPKYSDKPKKEETKKVEKSTKVEPATVKMNEADAIPTTGYSIQLLATKKEQKANTLQKLMNSEGYPAYVFSMVKGTETLYRVRIGAYQEHDEADTIQARMKRRYTKNTHVQNSLVVAN